MTVLAQLTTTATSIGGLIYVLQVASQVYLYGFRGWWRLGLGTGQEVHHQRKRRINKG